jgi:hypothetical protein
MIVSIWVFFMLGEPTVTEPGTPYVQVVVPAWEHDHQAAQVEQDCAKKFQAKYPGHPVCDSGWCCQPVKVMGQ